MRFISAVLACCYVAVAASAADPEPTAADGAMLNKVDNAMRPYEVMAYLYSGRYPFELATTSVSLAPFVGSKGLTDANAAAAAASLGATGVPFWGVGEVTENLSAESLAQFYALANIRELPAETPAQFAAFRAVKTLPPLELLTFARPTSSDLDRLAALPSLKMLVVNDIGKGQIPALAKLRQLRKLGVNSATLTDADLAPLAALTGLTDVILNGPGFTSAVAGRFADAPVTRFFLTGGDPSKQFTDAGLAELAKLKGLNAIGLFGLTLTDAGFAKLEPLTALEDIYLDGVTGVTAAGVAHLAKLPKLKTVSVRGSPGAGPLAGLAGAPALVTVLLDGVDAAALLAAGGLPNVGKIGTKDIALTDADIVALAAKRPRLTLLEINPGWEPGDKPKLPLGDGAAKALADIPSLVELGLDAATLSDSGVATLAKLPNLKSLSLRATPLTLGGAAALAKSPKLERLILGEGTADEVKDFLRKATGGRVTVE